MDSSYEGNNYTAIIQRGGEDSDLGPRIPSTCGRSGKVLRSTAGSLEGREGSSSMAGVETRHPYGAPLCVTQGEDRIPEDGVEAVQASLYSQGIPVRGLLGSYLLRPLLPL